VISSLISLRADKGGGEEVGAREYEGHRQCQGRDLYEDQKCLENTS
jgi:hypothetical protein